MEPDQEKRAQQMARELNAARDELRELMRRHKNDRLMPMRSKLDRNQYFAEVNARYFSLKTKWRAFKDFVRHDMSEARKSLQDMMTNFAKSIIDYKALIDTRFEEQAERRRNPANLGPPPSTDEELSDDDFVPSAAEKKQKKKTEKRARSSSSQMDNLTRTTKRSPPLNNDLATLTLNDSSAKSKKLAIPSAAGQQLTSVGVSDNPGRDSQPSTSTGITHGSDEDGARALPSGNQVRRSRTPERRRSWNETERRAKFAVT